MKKYRQIGILTLLLWILIPLVLHAAPVGKVTAIEGEVDLAASGKEAKPVTPGDAVNVGDFIRTKSRSKCELTFIDGNILRLAENTRIQVSEYMIENDKRRETIGLLRGKIRSIVQKGIHALGTERGGHYEVRTPTAVMGVRGSDVINYYLNGISGGVFNQGNGYGYPLGAPQFIQNYGAGQMLMIIGINLPPILQTINQQQIDQHIYDTNLGSGSGGVTTTTAATTTGTTTATTAATTVTTTVAPSGPPSGATSVTTTSGTTTPTTVVTGSWTGNPYDRSLLPAAFVQPSTTMAPTTSIAPMTTVLPTTTVMTTVRPTTTVATTSTTSTTTAQSTTTTTVLPTTTTTTVATTTTSSTSTSSTTSTSSSTTSTSTTSTTTIPAGAAAISANITGLSTNPVAVSGYAYNTGAAGSVSVNSTEPVPVSNPWTIGGFAGNYGAGVNNLDGYFAGYTGSWEGLYHAIYFTGGNAGYTWGGMGAAGNVFTGTGPTYGSTTIGPAVGTTLTAWTQPPPRFGNITISAGAATFGTTGGTFNSAVKGVDLDPLSYGQKMGVWATTNTGSTFTTDGSATWQGIYYRGDANYEMVGRVYGSTSGTNWSIGASGGNDSALYYMDSTNFGKLILNYRAKGVGGVYFLAGAGSYFLDPLTYASTLAGPAITGPQSLDSGRMGIVTSASGATSFVHFLGTSALTNQSVWMNTISHAEAKGTIVGFKQTGTNTGGGDFSYQGVLYGLYYEDGMRGYLKATVKSEYNNDAFKMTGNRERELLVTASNTVDSVQDITATGGTSQYRTGQFNRFTGENWGTFSSYLTGTTWPTEFVAEANNGNLFHTLNMDASGGVPPPAPPGSPGGSRIGEIPVSGGWMNINDAVTGISGGQFYYQGPVTGWQAVAAGGWMETNQFIALRGSLTGTPSNTVLFDALKIPYTFIGQVALSGANSNTNVSLTAYFYGYSSATPATFISNNVTGTTLLNPNGTTLALSGTGFTANVNFTFVNWNTSTNRWAATVNTTGAGQLNPPSGPQTYMKGYSAGSFIPSASTSFSGTAAGAAYPMRAF